MKKVRAERCEAAPAALPLRNSLFEQQTSQTRSEGNVFLEIFETEQTNFHNFYWLFPVPRALLLYMT